MIIDYFILPLSTNGIPDRQNKFILPKVEQEKIKRIGHIINGFSNSALRSTGILNSQEHCYFLEICQKYVAPPQFPRIYALVLRVHPTSRREENDYTKPMKSVAWPSHLRMYICTCALYNTSYTGTMYVSRYSSIFFGLRLSGCPISRLSTVLCTTYLHMYLCIILYSASCTGTAYVHMNIVCIYCP